MSRATRRVSPLSPACPLPPASRIVPAAYFSSQHSAPSTQHFRQPPASRVLPAAYSIVETLERRFLLTADSDPAYIWAHLKPAFRHDLAIIEYNNPTFQAALDADLASYGLTPIPSEAGTLSPALSTQRSSHKSSARHPFRQVRIKLYHVKKPKLHRLDVTPPAVTDADYYYDQALPNQLAFTFDQDVTASNWNTALTVLNLNTGTTLAVSGTYSSALDTVVYNLNSSTILPDANYAAILHGSQITDTTHGLALLGSDSISGDDFFTNFFFKGADFNHDRSVNLTDMDTLEDNYGAGPGASFSMGDANYNGSITLADFGILASKYDTSLSLLTSTDTPTAYIASSSSADIFWDAPSDTLVTQYDLYRDSTLLASGVTDTGYLDTGLSQNTTYDYFVVSKDAAGDSAYPSPEAYIAIAPATPTLSLSGDASVTEGDTYYLGGSFEDANNDEPDQWSISWGDGTSATYSGFASDTLDADDSIGGPADAEHTYAQGTYTITGSALSDIGTYAANSLVVTVADATPTFSVLGDQTFVQGQPYTITDSFTDFDSPLTWSIAWGDGSTASSGTGSIPATLTHTYTSGVSAPYTLVANVATADGTYTNTTTVDAAMPSLSVTGAATVQQGATYTLTDSFSDPAGLAPDGWSIAWGDGATTTAAGSATSFTHVYSEVLAPGEPYTIAAYAADSNGSYYAASAEVTVDLTAPSLSLTDSTTLTVGSTVTVSNASATDGGDAIEGWTIAWGDGDSSYFPNNPSSFKHVYTLPGTFTLAGTAQTPDGSYTTDLALTVADHATLQFGLGSDEQNQLDNAGIVFSDPGSDVVPEGYTIWWGDGSSFSYGGDLPAFPALGTTYYQTYPLHDYQTYGPITLTATVDTNVGTYIATSSETILPNLDFSIGGLTEEESGMPLDVAVGYNGSDPLPAYTIDWGDGTTTTASTRDLDHAYTFDAHWPDPAQTYWGNFRNFEFSAVEGGETYSTTGSLWVYDSGAGTLSLAPSATATEGQWLSLTGSWTDPYQTDPELGVGVRINWGDGTTSGGNSELGVSHVYELAGTYTAEFDAVYQDENSGLPDQPLVDVAYVTVTVGHSEPTFEISGATSTLEGAEYSLNMSFYHSGSNEGSQQLWTIAWGDGATTFDDPDHVYATPGNYSIVATDTTDEGTYTATWNVSIPVPALTIHDSGGGVVDEESHTTDYFVVTRSDLAYAPLTVNFTLGGTAGAGQYELTDSAGDILTDSLTIPANVTLCTVFVSAVDDNTPEWTDTLAMTLGASSAYTLDPTYNTAATEIVDNDLGITLGNGGGNIILQGGSDGTQNLVPLVLNFPQAAEAGAVVTLSDPADTEADVWTTSTPGPSDHPILGDDNGTYHSSVAWTYGVNSPSETTFWVGGTDGSAAMDDISFGLSDSDADASPAPDNPTTNSAATKPATDVTVTIISKNNPNDSGQPASLNVTGVQRGWLVGQMADLVAEIHGPDPLIHGLQYAWTTQGNVLRAMQGDGTSKRTAIQLSANDGGGPNLPLPSGDKMNTGTALPEIALFWANLTDSGPDADSVALTVSGNGLHLAPVKTTFLVTNPTFSNEIVLVGTPGISPDGKRIGIFNVTPANPNVGAIFQEQIDMPAGFGGQGQWKFVQKVNPGEHVTARSAAAHNPYNHIWVLDDKDPYAGVDQWATGSGPQTANDTPQVSITSPDQTEALDAPFFKMFVEFMPPGTGSQWAVVREIDWNFNIQELNNLDGKGWHLPTGYIAGVNTPSFQIPTEVPQWEQAAPSPGAFVAD